MGNTLPHSNASTHTGTVYKRSMGVYDVHTEDGRVVVCELTSMLRKNLEGWFGQSASTNIRREVKRVKEIRQVDPVAIGDCVRFTEAGEGRGIIAEVLPRRNKLSRMEPGMKRREQIIVANVDAIIPVVAARTPPPKWNLLDRYLATADEAGIPAIICMTKMDLVSNDADVDDAINTYREIGYRVLLTSAETGLGIDALRRALRRKVTAFVGLSGVGKSTLLNAIQPGLGARVKAINEHLGKGRHTTTHLELYPLEDGGGIVDTPGMKLFGLYDIDRADLALHYREMAAYIGKCRFGLDCTHVHEPGCAILAAVDDGAITERRYESYLYLRDHMQAAY